MAPRIVLFALAFCVFAIPPISAQNEEEGCAHVVGATASQSSSSSMENHNSWTISATVSSTETGWDKYADEWKVASEDGTVFGTRTLGHPHVTEQPFTRSLSGVDIPDTVNVVTISARDSVLGYCGDTYQLTLLPDETTATTDPTTTSATESVDSSTPMNPSPTGNANTTNSTGTLLDFEEEYSNINATYHDDGSDEISMNSTLSSSLRRPPRSLVTVQIENEFDQDELSSTTSSGTRVSTFSFVNAALPSLMVVLWMFVEVFVLEAA